jgi:anti-anti-sigma factor
MPAFDPNAGTLEVRTEPEGDGLVIRAIGELDLAACKAFETEVNVALQSDAAAVSLDLRDLSFIDSTGLRALVIAVGLSEAKGRRPRVVRQTSPAVQRTFDLTGIGDRLPFVDETELVIPAHADKRPS